MKQILLAAALCFAASAAPAQQALVPSGTDSAVAGAVASPIPPGTNIGGKFGIDQSVPGASNGVMQVEGPFSTGTCSASCNGTVLLGPIDTSNMASINVQMRTAGSGTIAWQASDEYNCNTATAWNTTATQGNSTFNDIISTNSSNLSFFGAWTVPVVAKCMRLTFTAYSSGTFTAQAWLRPFVSAVNIMSPVGAIMFPTPGNAAQGTTSATGTTGSITATLANVAFRTAYVCDIEVTSAGTTSPAAVTVTLGTLVGNSLSFIYYPTTAGATLSQHFSPCIPAADKVSGITLTVPALGAGTTVAADIHGFWY